MKIFLYEMNSFDYQRYHKKYKKMTLNLIQYLEESPLKLKKINLISVSFKKSLLLASRFFYESFLIRNRYTIFELKSFKFNRYPYNLKILDIMVKIPIGEN
ncbi:MAG: hypothetical protein EAX96_07205 [Candidatus Lokiarchaeota archaeon]|nr:hypothetical protein [Candidatus Lokiarchaeota archaeon]